MTDILTRLANTRYSECDLNLRCFDAAAEISRLRAAIDATLDENGHLADGDVCTLAKLKKVATWRNDYGT